MKWYPANYAYASHVIRLVDTYGLEVEYAPWYHTNSGSCGPLPFLHGGVPLIISFMSWKPTFCTVVQFVPPPEKPPWRYSSAPIDLGSPIYNTHLSSGLRVIVIGVLNNRFYEACLASLAPDMFCLIRNPIFKLHVSLDCMQQC